MSKATIKVEGKNYEGWKRTTITRSIEQISSVFNFDFTDSWTPGREPWGINPQDAVSIAINGTSLIKGSVDILRAQLRSERTYTAQGRDASADLVDCSAVVKQYKNLSLLDLCNELSSVVGVSFALANPTVNNKRFLTFSINPGEKIFEAIERAVRQRGVLCVPDGSGGVFLTTAGLTPAVGSLLEGENCKAVEYSLDYSERYSDYTVLGQKASEAGWEAATGAAKGTSKDAGVKRKRPLILQAEQTIDSAEAQVRAAWEANVRAARSTSVSVETYSWFQAPGLIWQLNQTVNLKAPRLGIGGNFLICDITYKQDEQGGTTTEMKLVPPDAFKPDPSVKKKKSDQVAKGWSF